MTVTLSEETRKLVEAQLEDDGASSVDAMVNQIVQRHLSPLDLEDEALEASLITALAGSRYAYTRDEALEHVRRGLETISTASA